jgi:hypothetical protein
VDGTFYVSGRPEGPGYKAQNNTQSVFTDPDTINRFQAELILEHIVAQKQSTAKSTHAAVPAKKRAAAPAKK